MTGVLCLGLAALDHVYKVEAIPQRPEKHRASDLAVVGGGCAANAAVAVARLGGQSWLAARLGDDVAGDVIVAQLEADGVACGYARRFAGQRSPVSAILVDREGERLVVSYSDPAMLVDPGWLPATCPAGVGAVLGDTRWIEGAVHLFATARAEGLPAILDADRAPQDQAVYATASHIAFSAQALREVTGQADLQQAVAQLAQDKPCWIAVTDGPRGVWHWDGRSVVHTPAFGVTAVDTLGAGDVWHGAFALALAERQDEPSAIRFANAAAAIKCTRFGGRDGAPTRSEVDALLRSRS